MKLFDWVVVGAGPAGIAAVGKLIELGVIASDILWIDPEFKIGDFGTAWRQVNSNTSVESFLKFYRGCRIFNYDSTHRPVFMIDKIEPNKNCPLMLAAEPLRWITQQLTEQVKTMQDNVIRLTPLSQQTWKLSLQSGSEIQAKKVILTIGGEAKELVFENIETVALKTALNLSKLKEVLRPDDCVAVFGSAQSAKSVVDNLNQIPFKKSMVFYRSEHSMNRHFPDEILENIQNIEMTPKNLLEHMPSCTKIICAIGFERRHIPIAGLPKNYGYDKKTGVIAPGMFGLGMAFPEILPHELGQAEYQVTAIWPFMKRLKKLMPDWLAM